MLGGLEVVIQGDESVISRRKYNRGRVVRGKWVLGLFDTTTKKSIIVYITDGKSETLLDVTREQFKPGLEIWTNCWSGCKCMNILFQFV